MNRRFFDGAMAELGLLPLEATTTGQIKYWDGAAFTAKPVKYWDGAAWTVKPLKYWNGSAWVETTY